MANDAFTQQALANDPTFRQRVKASMTRIAFQVFGELASDPKHAARAGYARAFLANPDAVVNSVVGWLVFRTNIIGPTTLTTPVFDGRGGVVVQNPVTDAALDSQIFNDWDNMAGS